MDINVGSDLPGVGMSGEPSARLSATNNWNSTIVQAAGSVIMTQRETLPVSDIPPHEVAAVQWAWVGYGASGAQLDAIDRIRAAFKHGGIAVVGGSPGVGKKAAAIRALWEERQELLSSGLPPIALRQVTPDWDKPAIALLPRLESSGYLLDVASEIDSWENAQDLASALVDYGNKLRESGSCLVVIASEHGWPQGSSATSQAYIGVTQRPSPRAIAIQHLDKLYGMPDRASWLAKSDKGESSVDGVLAYLITDETYPSDASALALSLSRIEDSPKAQEAAAAEFQQWRDHLNKVFATSVGEADDRALLIATSFLEGAPALDVQAAARELLGGAVIPDAASILAGPDLKTRFEGLGVSVKSRRTDLDAKPGLARAVLRHVWEQRPDFHDLLLQWVRSITRPDAIGSAYVEHISSMLVDLAIAEGDERILDLAFDWASTDNVSEQQHLVIANMMQAASESPSLGPLARDMLLKWSQGSSESLAFVVALVCMTNFSEKFPRQTLVRLRWILLRQQRDSAVIKAEEALSFIATKPGLLPRVWNNVVTWVVREKNIAGRRGFLALVNPDSNPLSLQVLMAAAEKDDDVADNLVQGWSEALEDGSVYAEASAALAGWAMRISDRSLFRDSALEILDRVVARHLTTSPVSALLFGHPGEVTSTELIELRRAIVRRHFPESLEMPE